MYVHGDHYSPFAVPSSASILTSKEYAIGLSSCITDFINSFYQNY